MTADSTPRTGQQLGDFRLDARLGRGAFKVVYAATNLNAAANGYPKRVAICIPHYQDAEARQLLENEMHVLQTLSHRAIVEVYGLAEADNTFFLVMELVEGQPLNRLLAERGPLPLEQAVDIARQVGEALDYAHDGLAIHRDIKPGNLMLRADGRAKILAAERPLDLLVWSETRGLRNGNGQMVTRQSSRDPVAALQFAIESRQEAIFVFLDIHRHFTPVTVRLIRDCVWTVKRQRKSLVFISPDLRLPEELRSDTTLLFFDLPDMTDLEGLADALAVETGQSVGGELRQRLARALLGLTHREAERALRRGFLRQRGWAEACVAEVLAEKEQIVRKEGILEFRRPDVSFADVGGLERLKAWFTERRQAFSPEGRRFGLRLPCGAVLAGVPGCGKSLSAKALAADWQVPLLRLDLGRVYRSLLGQSEANLRRALHTAEQVSPCVLWIDELEKAFSGLGQVHDSGVTQRLFGTFLTWMEERQAPVFVVATANDIGRLPPEFTRKGRFDEVFFVDLPGAEERRSIFSVHLRRRKRSVEGFDLDALVQASECYSGAEIEEAIISGLYRAFDDQMRPLTTEDVRHGLRTMIPLSRSRAEDLNWLRQWAAVNARLA